MGANEKVSASIYPDVADAHACRDCGSQWSSQSAAIECEFLDSIEARTARRAKG